MISLAKLSTKLIFAAVIFMMGCQVAPYRPYARSVKVKPKSGGIIALKSQHRDEDRSKAETIMGRTCAGLFEITEEGEVVTGTTTSGNTNYNSGNKSSMGTLFGLPVTTGSGPSNSSNSTTSQNKEWQIKYKCLAKRTGGKKKKMIR